MLSPFPPHPHLGYSLHKWRPLKLFDFQFVVVKIVKGKDPGGRGEKMGKSLPFFWIYLLHIPLERWVTIVTNFCFVLII